MKHTIHEILTAVATTPNRKDKIKILQLNDSYCLRDLMICVFNPDVKFQLPESDPPYKPADSSFGHEMIYSQIKKLYLFLEGGNPDLKQHRREELFIQFLESIHPDDAKLMLQIKNKKMPFPGITAKLINEAFPGLLPEKEKEKTE